MTEFDSDKSHIVMLHNRYQYAGGEDASTQAEIAVLRQFGHPVTYLEEHNDQIKQFNSFDKIKLFFTTAWNPQQAKTLRSQLITLKPDILHVQNFFPLFSPSVHKAAKSLNIPTIQHLRNFRLGCLNGYLYRHEQICEVCLGHNPWKGITYRCYRGSFPSSLAVWNMISLNRWRRTWQKEVDAFITPSRFAAEKLIEIGIKSDRLYVKPNVTPDPLINQDIPPLPQQPTFLYLGRLSPEKGVMILLQAWKNLNQPQWQLNIIGDGPQRETLQQFIQETNLNNITLVGHKPMSQVIEAIKQATVVVVPSQWYETFGRVVIEAFSCGRGVLVSNLGALSELVQEGKNGFLITPHDIEEWRERLDWCGRHPSQINSIGQQARQFYRENYTPQINYQELMKIYLTVM